MSCLGLGRQASRQSPRPLPVALSGRADRRFDALVEIGGLIMR
jgi:hypothetical protein